MSKKIIVANWKAAVASLAEAQDILNFVDEYLKSIPMNSPLQIIFCPPFVFTEEVAKILREGKLTSYCALGAQDIAVSDVGAQTGEVSGDMLSKLGVEYVIAGHSERRWKMGESDTDVNQKIKTALSHNLVPIVCLGEKDQNKDREKFLTNQTEETFKDLSAQDTARCMIAYEPVWAISTNPDAEPDTPESAAGAIEIIKKVLAARHPQLVDNRFLYGGSVNSINAATFTGGPSIHGLMVGSASVKKDEFIRILGAR